MMGVRLLEMRRLLKLTGSIYLHCDPTANHYLKLEMDAVFGAENFRSEITWRRTNAKGLAFKGYPNNADYLLYYTKSSGYVWDRPFRPHDPEYVNKFYNNVEPETGDAINWTTCLTQTRTVPILPMSSWALHEFGAGLKSEWKRHTRKVLVVQKRPGAVPRYKRYLDEMQGVPVDTIWDDIQPIQANSKSESATRRKSLLLFWIALSGPVATKAIWC